MPGIEDTSRPHLAIGCRWAPPNGQERMLLFPEGAVKLQGTGRQILELCDGNKTLREITSELQAIYRAADADQIKREVISFVEQLREKRIVDY